MKLEDNLESVDSEDFLRFAYFSELVDRGYEDNEDRIYDMLIGSADQLSSIGPLEAINLMQARDFVTELNQKSEDSYDISPFEERLEDYFEEVDMHEDILEVHKDTFLHPESTSIKHVLENIEVYAERYEDEEAEKEIKEYLYILNAKDEVNLA